MPPPTPHPEPAPTWQNLFYPPENYLYFDSPAPFDPQTNPAPDLKAAWLADAAMLAYGRSGETPFSSGQMAQWINKGGFSDFDLVGNWSAGAKGTQGFFACNNNWAVLSFRGTERDDWRDLASDLNAVLVDERNYAPHPLESNKTLFRIPSLPAILDPNTPGVHRGFQAALNEVWDAVKDRLAKYRDGHAAAEIYFTGHSLGAALATLAASRFQGGNASLYTIGCPRVGNRAFNDYVRDRVSGRWNRFVNRNDLVTHLPPALLWYEHDQASLRQLGTPRPAERGFQELLSDLHTASQVTMAPDLQARPPDDLVDHSPGRYCSYIWNLT